jgi:hypothetical protein
MASSRCCGGHIEIPERRKHLSKRILSDKLLQVFRLSLYLRRAIANVNNAIDDVQWSFAPRNNNSCDH